MPVFPEVLHLFCLIKNCNLIHIFTVLQPEPMDTGTDDGEDDKPTDRYTYGVLLPPAPVAKTSQKLQVKFLIISIF